ncbi:hypothetical protein F5148DRAFT_22463 [Russula earlei]|uniref:Uncharacterized protein n=1 Tax=Russula earlei TaxID=71964 RepID=A0ACC0UAL5_9AGAM|nr:hypothetical protein F5148DRAFT_22463 [Russula earlei]
MHRITHSVSIEARYTTSLCWEKHVHQFCRPVIPCLLYLVLTSNRGYSPSNAVAVPRRVTNSLVGTRVERRRYFSNLCLRDELMRLYHTTVPVRQSEVHEKRQRKITSSIRRHFGPAYHVEVFGSTEYGVDGPTSDLDLVVIVGILLTPHI